VASGGCVALLRLQGHLVRGLLTTPEGSSRSMSLALCRASCARRPIAIPVSASRAHAMRPASPATGCVRAHLCSPLAVLHWSPPWRGYLVCSAARSCPRSAPGHVAASGSSRRPSLSSRTARPRSPPTMLGPWPGPWPRRPTARDPPQRRPSDPAKASPATPKAEGSGNGAASSEGAKEGHTQELPLGDPEFTPLQGLGQAGRPVQDVLCAALGTCQEGLRAHPQALGEGMVHPRHTPL